MKKNTSGINNWESEGGLVVERRQRTLDASYRKSRSSKKLSSKKSKTLASWHRRAAAWILDTLIVVAITAGLAAVLVPLIIATDSTSFSIGDIGSSGYDFGALALKILVASLVALLAGTFYYCLTMARRGSHNGQTLGKQIFNITVIREDGKQVGLWFAFVRQILVMNILFGKIGGPQFLYIPWAVNYLWPLWDPGNQALHDKIVHSRVIRTDV